MATANTSKSSTDAPERKPPSFVTRYIFSSIAASVAETGEIYWIMELGERTDKGHSECLEGQRRIFRIPEKGSHTFCCCWTVTFPLDITKTRLQIQREGIRSGQNAQV